MPGGDEGRPGYRTPTEQACMLKLYQGTAAKMAGDLPAAFTLFQRAYEDAPRDWPFRFNAFFCITTSIRCSPQTG